MKSTFRVYAVKFSLNEGQDPNIFEIWSVSNLAFHGDTDIVILDSETQTDRCHIHHGDTDRVVWDRETQTDRRHMYCREMSEVIKFVTSRLCCIDLKVIPVWSCDWSVGFLIIFWQHYRDERETSKHHVFAGSGADGSEREQWNTHYF